MAEAETQPELLIFDGPHHAHVSNNDDIAGVMAPRTTGVNGLDHRGMVNNDNDNDADVIPDCDDGITNDIDGLSDGCSDGCFDGCLVGSYDGSEDGLSEGPDKGSLDGSADGSLEGSEDGSDDKNEIGHSQRQIAQVKKALEPCQMIGSSSISMENCCDMVGARTLDHKKTMMAVLIQPTVCSMAQKMDQKMDHFQMVRWMRVTATMMVTASRTLMTILVQCHHHLKHPRLNFCSFSFVCCFASCLLACCAC